MHIANWLGVCFVSIVDQPDLGVIKHPAVKPGCGGRKRKEKERQAQ
jgi:hypothetical protein